MLDALGNKRTFLCIQSGANKHLHDRRNNVHTHDFNFQDIELASGRLPGDLVPNPPAPWESGAVSAHANAAAVIAFLRDVLMRNGLDNLGEPLISSVNCTYFRHGTDSTGREWRNAAWIGKQMVYGQRRSGTTGSTLRSYAAAFDVVAHEVCHGLTERTARLEYQDMTGALNESYSDIFGIIISNFAEPDVTRWNWEMGENLAETGIPLRDVSDPRKFGQPAHIDEYVQTTSDFGGVHINSGIHNKAAHLMLTAQSSAGAALFTPTRVAQLFYLALTQHLSRTSGFTDSRRGVLLAARSLFRQDSELNAKLAAIRAAFDGVGITEN
jgi:Zn-dependent metalloprotease